MLLEWLDAQASSSRAYQNGWWLKLPLAQSGDKHVLCGGVWLILDTCRRNQ
jgi:hypothetical protein